MNESWKNDWKDYYKILQVDSLAEQEIITAAYRKLADKYHPDLNKKTASNKRMTEINIAYEYLNDPEKRKQYDEEWSRRNIKNDSPGFQNVGNTNSEETPPPEQPKTKYQQKSKGSVRNKYRIILLSSACLIVIFLLTWHFAFSSTNKTPTSTVNNSPSTTFQLPSNDSWVGDLSKVAGISLADIPPGSYVSDAYLGTRTLVIKGNLLTMDCEATTGNSADFPQLGTHTYQYVLLGDWNTQPTLDECYEIYLKDVVSGNIYMPSFTNMDGHGIIVLGGDSYTIK